MKNILIIVLLFFAAGLQAQILPNQSPEKTPQGSDAIYTQENGQLNKILFDSAFYYFIPRINVNILGYNLDTLNATNPDSLRGQFVRDVSESWHYVDSSGLAFKFAASSSGGGGGGGATTLNQLTDVTLTSSATGEVLRYNGSLWVNDSIKSLHNIDSLSFNTSAPSVTETGSLGWNNEDQTLDLKINGVALQIGQEMIKLVKNVSGATIQNGQVVRYSGAVGASSRIEADLMIANGTYQPYHTIGVAAEDIPNGEMGFITSFGALRGINTSGYTAGDILYVDPTTPGALTNVEPTAPNQDIPVAIALDSKNNGSIFVRPVLFPALNDVQDVTISNIATGQVLRYDGTKWANSTERDTSDTNEIQYLTFRGDTLELTDDPTNVILPYLRVESDPIYAADSAQLKADIAALFVDSTRLIQDSILVYFQSGVEVGRDTVDGSATNEIQTLSLATNTLSLSNGGSVDLSSYLDNTDAQTLGVTGDDITLTNGGSVSIINTVESNTAGSTAITIDLQSARNRIVQIDMTSASTASTVTLAVSYPVIGGVYTFHFQNTNSGGHDVDFPTTFLKADGTAWDGSTTVNYSADDWLTCYYDGTNYHCK